MKIRTDGVVLWLLCCVGMLGIGLFSLPTAAVYFGGTFFWGYILLAAVAVCGGVLLFRFLPSADGKLKHFGMWIYTLFYTAIAAFSLVYYAHTVQSWFLDGVPHFFVALFLIAVCLFMARKPTRILARALVVIGVFVLPAVVVMRCLMLFSGDMRNLLPLFETAQVKQITVGVLFLTGFFVPLGLLGIWDADKKTKLFSGLSAVWVCAGIYILASGGCISILGPNQTAVHLDSTVLAMKNLNLSKLDLLQRGDIVFILTWSFLMPAAGALLCHIPYASLRALKPRLKNGYAFWLFFAVYALAGAVVPNEETALHCLIYTAVGGGGVFMLWCICLLFARRRR